MNKYEEIRFVNPYASRPDFVFLGHYDMGYIGDDRGGTFISRLDLYALTDSHANGKWISFGARYGDEPSEYLSGEAVRGEDKQWVIVGGDAINRAAAVYFANHW